MNGLNEEIKKEVDDLVKLYDDEAFSNITDIIENITFLFSLKEIDLKEKEKELSASILGTEYIPFFMKIVMKIMTKVNLDGQDLKISILRILIKYYKI